VLKSLHLHAFTLSLSWDSWSMIAGVTIAKMLCARYAG
jgi:hypothetical protein